MRRVVALGLPLALVSCGANPKAEDPADDLVAFVESHKIGKGVDQWIEIRNIAGEWEKTALIFGYLGDYDECQKALEGLKNTNYARDYRCVPARQKRP